MPDPIHVYLTLDFFLHRWTEPGREVWATLQPHVHEENLEAYLTGKDEDNFQYVFVSGANCPPADKMVPTNFRSAVNLDLRFYDGGGIPLERAHITDWAALRNLLQGVLADRTVAQPARRLLVLGERVVPDLESAIGGPPNPTDPPPTEEAIEKMLTAVNAAVSTAEFYRQQDFAGVKLSDETQKLLKTGPEQLPLYLRYRLNRLLLVDAFGGLVVPVAHTPIVRRNPDRGSINKLQNASQLRDLNREPPRQFIKDSEARTQDETRDPPEKAFAYAYNDSLLAFWNYKDTTLREDARARLPQMLRLAFWGGATRAYLDGFPSSTFAALDPDSVMDLPITEEFRARIPREGAVPKYDSTKLRATNLHSLCGLMFRLGRADDLERLKRILGFELDITWKDKSKDKSHRVPAGQQALDSVGTYFKGLGKLLPAPGGVVSARLEQGFSRRVYIRETLTPFAPRLLGDTVLHQRAVSPTEDAAPTTLKSARRLLVQWAGTTAMPPTLANRTLGLRFFSTFEVRLVPYRHARADSAGRLLMRLVPTDANRKRFFQEFKAGSAALARAVLVTAAPAPGQPARRVWAGDGSVTDLSLVGVYSFPWDLDESAIPEFPDELSRTTVLFHGKPLASEQLTLLLPRPYSAGPSEQLSVQPQQGLQVPSWQVAAPAAGFADVVFDAVECTHVADDAGVLPAAGVASNLPEEQRMQFVVNVAFEGDLEFQFAQGATQVEAAVAVTFPPIPTLPSLDTCLDPLAADVVSDWLGDLVNHNAMAVSFASPPRGGGALPLRYEPLYPWGRLYPVETDHPQGQGPVSKFHFRHRIPLEGPPVYKGAQPEPAWKHLARLYGSIGMPRPLAVELEHTYGTRIQPTVAGDPGRPTVSTESFFDFLPLLPSDVLPIGKPSITTDPRALLAVAYTHARDTDSEKLQLKFNTELLNEARATNPNERGAYLAGWRAIAELAHADKVHVRAYLLRFDWRSLVAQHPESTGLAAALRQVTEFPELGFTTEDLWWDVTEALKQRALACLQGGDLSNLTDVELPPKRPERPALFKTCNVLAFELELIRQDAMLPEGARTLSQPPASPTSSSWSLVRPGGDSGQPDAIEWRQFEEYLRTLRTSTSPLRPLYDSDAAREQAYKLRQLVGSGEARTARLHWIVPEDKVTRLGGSVIPELCPLTFRPVEDHPALAHDTTVALRRYFVSLQGAVDASFEAMGRWSASDWKRHFDTLQALQKHDSAWGRLLEACAGLVRPLSNAVQPSAELTQLVAELNTDLQTLQLNRPGGPFVKWLRRTLWRMPGLFDETKAFLHNRLRSDKEGGRLSPDFFEVASQKLIRQKLPAHASPTSAEAIVDSDRFRIIEALAQGNENASRLDFVEILDDRRYDNEFEVSSYSLRTFEALIEALLRPSAQSWVDDVLVPTLRLPRNTNPERPREIRLASRDPLVPPVHLFTGVVAACQQRSDLKVWKRDTEGDLEALLEGELLVATNVTQRRFVVEARTDLIERTDAQDDLVLTSIFAIRGDEEAATSLANAFANDCFAVEVETASEFATAPAVDAEGEAVKAGARATGGPTDAQPPVQSSSPPPPVGLQPQTRGLLLTLADLGSPEQLPADQLGALITDTTLRDVAAMLRPLKNNESNAPLGPASFQITQDPAVPQRFAFDRRVLQSGKNRFELLLLKPASTFAPKTSDLPVDDAKAAPAPVARGTFLLMVNAHVSVWERQRLALRQSRNSTSACDAPEVFATEFNQRSEWSRDSQQFQPTVTARLDTVMALPRKQYSAEELIRHLVLACEKLPATQRRPIGELSAWRNSPVSITVFHAQKTFLPVAYPNGSSRVGEHTVQSFSSRFPLSHQEFKDSNALTKQMKTWFPEGMEEFELDFRWTSESNLPFFAIVGVRVKMDANAAPGACK